MMKLMSIATVLCTLALADDPVVTVLPNGLTVITRELHYAPVVSTLISYGVGSRYEAGPFRGMSHFVEHMMFKGTSQMPKSRFWQIVQRDGGMANAQEGEDITYYWLLLPASRVEDALMIESDRMCNCLIDSAEIVSEINVVEEERRMVCIDNPEGALMEAVYKTAFTVHPYGQPVLGYDSDISGYDGGMTRAFYERYYCPSNAVLAVVGDFETDSLLAMIEEYFGRIPSGSVPLELISPEPMQTEARYVEVEHASPLPMLAMSFHAPSGDDPLNPAMSVISSYLSGGRTGRLDEVLVETGLVHDVHVNRDSRLDPGLFTIFVTMNSPDGSDVTVEEIQNIIRDELDSICENGIPPELLEDLKSRYRASMIIGSSNPLGLAFQYASGQSTFGSYRHREEQMALVVELTPGDIREAASSCFRRNGITVGVMIPSADTTSTRESSDLPTEITAPDEMNFDGLEIPDEFLKPGSESLADGVLEFSLDNGLVLLVREDHTFPVVGISFAVPMGSLREPRSMNGLTVITTDLMLYGTEELSRIEFHRRLEREGMSINLYPFEDHSLGLLTLLSEDLETGFTTVADILLRPAFREVDFDLVRNEELAGVTVSENNTFNMAWNGLTAITAENPAEIAIETSETLGRITLSDVRAYHEECCRPSGTVLVVVGDVDPDQVYSMAQENFGSWQNPSPPLPPVIVPSFSTAPGDTVVTFIPGRQQATVLIATEAPGYKMADYAAFETMNTILGSGGLGTRLGHSVRDVQGLAYGVGSWVISHDSTGTFNAYFSTLSDYVPQATISVVREMETISSENVSDIELRLAKACAVGEQAMAAMNYYALSYRLADLYSSGRPLDWYNGHLTDVLSLTADDLRNAAVKYFGAGNYFISIAGTVNEEIMTASDQR